MACVGTVSVGERLPVVDLFPQAIGCARRLMGESEMSVCVDYAD